MTFLADSRTAPSHQYDTTKDSMLAQHGDDEQAMKTLDVEAAMEAAEPRRRPSTQDMLDAPNEDGYTSDTETDLRNCEQRARSDSTICAETLKIINESILAIPADFSASVNEHKTKTRAKHFKISIEVTTVLDMAQILVRKRNRHAVKLCAVDLKIHRTARSAPAYVTQSKFKDGIKMQRVTAVRAFAPSAEINIDCIRTALEAAMPLGSKFKRQVEVRAALEDAYHTVIPETLGDCTPIDLECQILNDLPATDPLIPAAGCLKGTPRPEVEQHRAARALKEARHEIREHLMTKVVTGTSKRPPKAIRRQIQQLGSPYYNGLQSQSQSQSQVPRTEQT
ncbi:hypothetical protein IQ07DRAFT_647319 [Pyrenochaeta sp. DS3sAY3a]|nr:hypothetical protein IQ07DRAFT_647319 [Pyrenochaeta sp. DS3sAY3a]